VDKGIRTLYPLGADGGANVTQPGVVALLGIALYVAGAGAASSLIGSLILKFGDQAARLAATPAPGAWTLVVDPAGLHRTALWHAWDTEQLERIAADQAAVASPFRGPPVTLPVRPVVCAHRAGRHNPRRRTRPVLGVQPPRQPEFAPNSVHATNHMSDRLLHSAAK